MLSPYQLIQRLDAQTPNDAGSASVGAYGVTHRPNLVTLTELMPWLRASANGVHGMVVDLRVASAMRCICLDCWRSWPEGGDCGDVC